jgi:hypothetical protein
MALKESSSDGVNNVLMERAYVVAVVVATAAAVMSSEIYLINTS